MEMFRLSKSSPMNCNAPLLSTSTVRYSVCVKIMSRTPCIGNAHELIHSWFPPGIYDNDLRKKINSCGYNTQQILGPKFLIIPCGT